MNKRLSTEDSQADRPAADTVSPGGHQDALSSGRAILLVDDNPEVARAMRIAFDVAGHRLEHAASPEEAYSRLSTSRFDAILLDLNFAAGRTNGEEGLACLARMITDDPTACVVVLTAHSGIRIAVAAMQAGARDFVMKPWRNAELLGKVEAAIARGFDQPDGGRPAARQADPALLLGESAAIARVRELIRRVGPTAAGVAVTGPSGSGRHLVARAIHAASLATTQPLISVDLRDQTHWERLDQGVGTLILQYPDRLDEIAQARLVERMPSLVRPISIVDDLRLLVPPLRSRIATIEIAVPPLSARGDDAIVLARHFSRIASERHGVPLPTLTAAAEQLIVGTVWADEVRGLADAIERAVLLANDGVVDAAALVAPAPAPSAPALVAPAFDLSDNERAIIAAALREHHHNVSHAAAALGLSRGALYRRMERYGL